MVEEILRDLGRRGAVQRRLAVAAAGMDQRRIAFDELAQPIEHPEMRRREHIHDRAAGDERRGFFRCDAVLEQPEPARPPCTFQIEIGAVGQQHVEHRQILRRARNRPAVEMADGSVDGRAHVVVRLEERADRSSLAGVQGDAKSFNRRLCRRLARHRDYSDRRATTGSTPMARRAGNHTPISATSVNTTGTITNTSGSRAVTP